MAKLLYLHTDLDCLTALMPVEYIVPLTFQSLHVIYNLL